MAETDKVTNVEKLATLKIEKHRGVKAELHIVRADRSIFVLLGPEGESAGIVVGKGATKLAALSDAQSSLQSALDSVDLAILKTSREN